MLQKSLAIVAILLLTASAMPAGTGLAESPPPNLIVGFDERRVDVALLKSLGATVNGQSDALGMAAVYSSNPTGLMSLLALHPRVAWVETNDITRADSSQWDASGWDASGWDSSQWDASGWDASGWDSSQWDASGWDASGWDEAEGAASGWDASGWDASGWDSATMSSIGSAQGPSGTDPLVRWQWSLAAMNLSREATSGAPSKTICFVDSGIDHTHPEFAGRYMGGYDFVNKDNDAMDDGGHGTHVAGIAAAATGNGKGIAGTAPAKITAAKVLAANGTGTEFDLALGIDWCASNGAHVISMSLGTPENSKAVHRAITDAFARGIVLVASAGNTGTSCDCVRYPAAYPQVISVGAVMPDGQRAPFSAVSHGVDLVAPGYAIVSTLPGDHYGKASGTSQAVPFVSGAAALLLAQGADGSAAALALRDTATDLGAEGADSAFGYGAINVGAALDAL